MPLTGNPFIPGTDVGSAESGGVLKLNLVAGGASGTELGPTTPLRPGDIVIAALEAPSGGGITADRRADLLSIGASGALTFGGATTAGANLLVIWLDKVPA